MKSSAHSLFIIGIFICMLTSPHLVLAQLPADTLMNSTTTVRNSTSDQFYYGFAEGDRVGFSFDEIYGSSLRSFCFFEYPSSKIFSQNNVTSIDKKEFVIPRKGIYYFSLAQSGFLAGRRHCRLIVWRIPANEEVADFNTTVYWETAMDTSWFEREERYLVRRDTLVTSLSDQTIKLDKKGKSDKSSISFMIPNDTYAWSWWVSTSKEAVNIFSQTENTLKASNKLVKDRGLMAYLAMGGAAGFASTKGAQSVSMNFLDAAQLQQFVSSTVYDSLGLFPCTTLFGISHDTLPGIKNLALLNMGKKKLNVSVKICVVQIWETWGTRIVRDYKLEEVRKPFLKN